MQKINLNTISGVRSLNGREMQATVGGGLLNKFGKKLCGKLKIGFLSKGCKKVVDVLV